MIYLFLLLSLYGSAFCSCLSVYDSFDLSLSNSISDYHSVTLLSHHVLGQGKIVILLEGPFCVNNTNGIGVLSFESQSTGRYLFPKLCAGKFSNTFINYHDSVPIGIAGVAIRYSLGNDPEIDTVVCNVLNSRFDSLETSEFSDDLEIEPKVVLFNNTLVSQTGLLLYKPLDENAEILGIFQKSKSEWLFAEQFGNNYARFSKYIHPEGLVIPGPETVLYGKLESVNFCGKIVYAIIETQTFLLTSFHWDQFHTINQRRLPDLGGRLKRHCLNENLIITGTSLQILRSVNLNLEFESKGFYRATTKKFDTSVSKDLQLTMTELFPDLMIRLTLFTSCDFHHFGKSCQFQCMCPSTTGNCDYGERGSGQCLSCKDGWAGRFCNIPCLTCPVGVKCLGGLNAPIGSDPDHICACEDSTKTGPSCGDCRPGYYYEDGEIEKPCRKCTTGFYCKNGVRLVCPPGTVSLHKGSSSCQECVNNTVPNNSMTRCIRIEQPSLIDSLFQVITNLI